MKFYDALLALVLLCSVSYIADAARGQGRSERREENVPEIGDDAVRDTELPAANGDDVGDMPLRRPKGNRGGRFNPSRKGKNIREGNSQRSFGNEETDQQRNEGGENVPQRNDSADTSNMAGRPGENNQFRSGDNGGPGRQDRQERNITTANNQDDQDDDSADMDRMRESTESGNMEMGRGGGRPFGKPWGFNNSQRSTGNNERGRPNRQRDEEGENGPERNNSADTSDMPGQRGGNNQFRSDRDRNMTRYNPDGQGSDSDDMDGMRESTESDEMETGRRGGRWFGKQGKLNKQNRGGGPNRNNRGDEPGRSNCTRSGEEEERISHVNANYESSGPAGRGNRTNSLDNEFDGQGRSGHREKSDRHYRQHRQGRPNRGGRHQGSNSNGGDGFPENDRSSTDIDDEEFLENMFGQNNVDGEQEGGRGTNTESERSSLSHAQSNRNMTDERSSRNRPNRRERPQKPGRMGKGRRPQNENLEDRFAACVWSDWSEFGDCVDGVQVRTRDVISGKKVCLKRLTEEELCESI